MMIANWYLARRTSVQQRTEHEIAQSILRNRSPTLEVPEVPPCWCSYPCAGNLFCWAQHTPEATWRPWFGVASGGMPRAHARIASGQNLKVHMCQRVEAQVKRPRCGCKVSMLLALG